MHESFAVDRLAGYPSFVRMSPSDPFRLDWWAPTRTGDYQLDFAAGIGHLNDAVSTFKGFGTLSNLTLINPQAALFSIVCAMIETGPMERGFLIALAGKASVGRIPQLETKFSHCPDAIAGEEMAHACLRIDRMASDLEVVASELVDLIGDARSEAEGFIWTVCGAATAGALN